MISRKKSLLEKIRNNETNINQERPKVAPDFLLISIN